MARKDFDPASIQPDGRPPARARLFDPDVEGPWRGSVEGLALGGEVTVLTYGTDTVGAGPRLHVHPYDETFIVVAGRARFVVGETTIEAGAGETVLGPAGVPHRFENLGDFRPAPDDRHPSLAALDPDRSGVKGLLRPNPARSPA